MQWLILNLEVAVYYHRVYSQENDKMIHWNRKMKKKKSWRKCFYLAT